jgi:hypothetical protein
MLRVHTFTIHILSKKSLSGSIFWQAIPLWEKRINGAATSKGAMSKYGSR